MPSSSFLFADNSRGRPSTEGQFQPVMSLEEARRSQRPYRYGMMLLCLGALINWLGLAENYSDPIRYAGVACILSGALLICTAMCCWLHTPTRPASTHPEPPTNTDDAIHVITVGDSALRTEKPPDYNTVISSELDPSMQPPSYDDAIKLNPALLEPYSSFFTFGQSGLVPPPPSTRPSSSAGELTIENLDTAEVIDEKQTNVQR